MKTIFSKSFFVLAFVLFLNINLKAQLTLSCESGNRTTEQNACWSFGAISYINTPGQVISGSWSTQSAQLTNPLPTASWIKTPWIKPGNGNITLKGHLSSSNGTTRGVVFSYIQYNPLNPPYYEGNTVIYDSTKWPTIHSGTINITSAIPVAIANSNDVYKIRISFVGTGGNSRIIADDIVIPGTYWSDPSNTCIPLPTLQDADQDGVDDNDDAFPNDQYKAYRSFFPIQNHFSSLAFEDLWPAKGDFDFNDVVVDYSSEMISNSLGQIVEINYQFKVRAIGASYKNGFGFELTNINPNAIRSVTGAVIKPGSIFNISANGTESGQSSATVIAIGNVYDVLPHVGSGITGVNTTNTAPYSTPQIVNVKLSFIENGVPGSSGPVSLSQIGFKTFNPFIVINQNREKEVHLADYKPTALANVALFGTLSDDSKPVEGRYYRTKNNLPWAINTYESFQYPTEKTDISEAYLKLIDWVVSNGTLFPDWDTNPTYRDNNKIYIHQ